MAKFRLVRSQSSDRAYWIEEHAPSSLKFFGTTIWDWQSRVCFVASNPEIALTKFDEELAKLLERRSRRNKPLKEVEVDG